MSFKIGSTPIGLEHPPFLIAELSGNHNQSLERALEIAEAAAVSGAHALKLQTYTADTITLDCREPDFVIDDPKSLWNGRNLYELYEEAHTPWDWHQPLMQRCAELGILCFSTPFDLSAVDFLDSLGVPAFKIASFECNHLPLLRAVAKTGKPVILSTGMASVGEMDEAVRTLREGGCNEIVLLKCTSNYPASPENSNVSTIAHLRELFGTEVGLSDHTMGVGTPCAAVAFGATVIEKHFTLRRADGGVDSAFSLEPEEFRALATETERAWQAKGDVRYGCSKAEEPSKNFRQSIYASADIAAGEALTEKNIRIVRPGFGLEPAKWEAVLGHRAAADIKRGTAIQWELLQ